MDIVAPQSEPDDEAEQVIRAAQAELDSAIENGRLTRDPLRLPLMGLRATLEAMLHLHRASVEHGRQTAAALDQRLAASAARPIEPRSLARLEEAAATGADRMAARLARAHNGRTVLIAAGALVGVAAAGLGGGYWAGGRAAAAGRLLTTCQGGEVRTDQDTGRRYCVMAVWLDPPLAPATPKQ